jgi:2'-5' RNA ligase
MRSFIAVNFSEEVKKKLAEIQHELKNAVEGSLKWVEEENLHLTLKFMGDVREDVLGHIKSSLSPVFKNYRQFKVEFKNVGAFPTVNKPRVLWVGIEKGKNELEKLAIEIENTLNDKLGIAKEERKFLPHITLARVKDKCRINFEKIAKYQDKVFAEDVVSKVDLMESKLTPSGPIYSVMYSWKLE